MKTISKYYFRAIWVILWLPARVLAFLFHRDFEREWSRLYY